MRKQRKKEKRKIKSSKKQRTEKFRNTKLTSATSAVISLDVHRGLRTLNDTVPQASILFSSNIVTFIIINTNHKSGSNRGLCHE